MKNLGVYLRYYLEIVALPIFIILVIHLSSEVVGLWGGLLLTALFVWTWRQPQFKKWVPCSHEHCHEKVIYSHLLAIFALCLHFFPEAVIRQTFVENLDIRSIFSVTGLIGFFAHFGVDIIVAFFISSYWKTKKAQIFSFLGIAGIWILAFFASVSVEQIIPEDLEAILLLLSAFLLAMFIHKPHKPKIQCGGCK